MDTSLAIESLPVLLRFSEKAFYARVSSSLLKLLEINSWFRGLSALFSGMLSLWIVRHA